MNGPLRRADQQDLAASRVPAKRGGSVWRIGHPARLAPASQSRHALLRRPALEPAGQAPSNCSTILGSSENRAAIAAAPSAMLGGP